MNQICVQPKYFEVSWKYAWPEAGVRFPRDWSELLSDKNRCPKCGNGRRYIGTDAELRFREPGKVRRIYRSSNHSYVIQDSVRKCLEKNNITGLKYHALKPMDEFGQDQQLNWLEVIGKMEVEWNSLGLTPNDVCEVCDSAKKVVKGNRLVPRDDAWDGSDFFGITNWYNLHICCTRRVVELAREQGWDELRFTPMDIAYGFGKIRGPVYVKHLAKKWPPKQWYPEGITPAPSNLETA